MAYVPHYRATFKGEFKTSASSTPLEQWNTSLALRGGGQYSSASAQAIVNDLRDDFSKFMDGASGLWGASVFFTEVRLDHVGANGKIDQDAVFATVDGGGKNWPGTTNLPPSCAMVLTLDTQTRGRSRFGRMYLPLLGMSAGTNGLVAMDTAQQLLTAAQTFITDVGNAPGIDDDFAVAVASGVGEGSLNTVRSIRVGRVVDTMRSRRRSLDESYLTATIST